MLHHKSIPVLHDLPEKTLLPEVAPDESLWKIILRWRPLVSYAGNRWRRLFALGGAYCVFVIDNLRLGFHRSIPRGITEEVHLYNRGQSLPMDRRRQRSRDDATANS